MQEHLSSVEAEKKELAGKLSSASSSAVAKDKEMQKIKADKESLEKQLAKMQEKIKIVEGAGKDSGKSGKDKDKLIAVSIRPKYCLSKCCFLLCNVLLVCLLLCKNEDVVRCLMAMRTGNGETSWF